ncbi:MAG TPA: hypothetical protein PKA63_10595 [Oligoflexia bacterium]|nr:hypothetical protein [Oligoflexia bacterium]HMP49106.1 hypothetical protein [Oligoflexia bacterium]
MENKIELKIDTMQKLQTVKNCLEGMEILKVFDDKLIRKLIDHLDDIAEDLQIDLPSAFDLGNEENYKGIDSCD